MNTKYIITDVSERKKFYGCPYICGVDIFPLDYIPNDEEELSVFRNLYTIIYSTAREYYQYTKEELEEYLKRIEEMCNTKIDREGNIPNQLWLLLDKVAGIFGEDECEYLTYLPTNICYDAELKYKKGWFKSAKRFPFEYISVPLPNGYDELLKVTYSDYMKYDKQRGRAHDYPFYKKQEEFLMENNLL